MTPLIETKNLKKYFKSNNPRGMLHAVDDISLSIDEGTTMGCVGESGCGKSTFGRTLIHLYESTDGQIMYKGKDITHLSKRGINDLRHEMQIVFQDPYASINPRMTIEDTIREALILSKRFPRHQISPETKKLIDTVGINMRMLRAYPRELSGGMRQRVSIARALALDPKFIVCDEPVSALDVSVQAQILNLFQDLQKEFSLTYLFITHDMSVVKHISDRIAVMYLGQLIETGKTREIFAHPAHPYTQALMSAIPSTKLNRKKERIHMNGEITSPVDPEPGCRFAKRCMYATEKCRQPQKLAEVLPGHFAACCRADEINKEEA